MKPLRSPYLRLLSALVALLITSVPAAWSQDAPAGGGSLSGVIFDDANKNGLLEQGDAPFQGVEVTLFNSDGDVVAMMESDVEGNYGFTGLAPDTYVLRFRFRPDFAVRSVGIEIGADSSVVFIPVPVITPDSRYDWVRLRLVNPANFKGEEVSPFTPDS